MRIAILADIHANLPALEAVLSHLEQQECDLTYHAGDLIAIGPYPSEVVDLAMTRPILSVQGNHDGWVVRGLPTDPIPGMDDNELMHQHWTHSRLDQGRRDFIKAMPHAIDEVHEGVRILVVHFALENDGKSLKSVNERGREEEILECFGCPEADIVCFGHLHSRPFSKSYGGTHFLNPGSVGCSHDGFANYAIVETSDGKFSVTEHRVPYDREALLARYDELEIPARRFIRRCFFGVEWDD